MLTRQGCNRWHFNGFLVGFVDPETTANPGCQKPNPDPHNHLPGSGQYQQLVIRELIRNYGTSFNLGVALGEEGVPLTNRYCGHGTVNGAALGIIITHHKEYNSIRIQLCS